MNQQRAMFERRKKDSLDHLNCFSEAATITLTMKNSISLAALTTFVAAKVTNELPIYYPSDVVGTEAPVVTSIVTTTPTPIANWPDVSSATPPIIVIPFGKSEVGPAPTPTSTPTSTPTLSQSSLLKFTDAASIAKRSGAVIALVGLVALML
jgi:hypothetical protein